MAVSKYFCFSPLRHISLILGHLMHFFFNEVIYILIFLHFHKFSDQARNVLLELKCLMKETYLGLGPPSNQGK